MRYVSCQIPVPSLLRPSLLNQRIARVCASLAAVGVAYVRFAYCNRAEFKIMFRPEMCSIAILGPDEPLDAYAVLVDAIVACQRSGAIAPGPPQPLVLAAWSLVHGLAALIVDGPDRGLAPDLASAEALAMSCVSTLAEGLRMRLPLRAPE